jgi:biotin carboxylase
VSSGKICFFNPSEYLLPLWANVVPATLPEAVEQQVRHLTQRVVEGFGIERGMLHLELFLTPDGPVFGEVAMRPPGGHLMELIETSYGFDIWEALLRVELGQTPQLPASAQRFSGVWFLHPGEGKVTAVTGVEAARRVPGVDDVECRLRAGERVERRESSGQSCGHIMASGDSREKVVTALKLACRSIVVETKRVPRRGAVRRHRAA